MQYVNGDIVKKIFRPRDARVHKGHFGHLLVIGGSRLYTGAPGLAGRAALRSGVDLVTVVAPERSADAIAYSKPDFITWPLRGDVVVPAHSKDIRKLLEEKSAYVVGNGMWGPIFGEAARKKVWQVIRRVVSGSDIPGVCDAEAIYALGSFAKRPDLSRVVLTPHAHEFWKLTGKRVGSMKKDKQIQEVQRQAKKWGTTIVLKGNEDIVSDGRQVVLNKTGNPYMTKAGTGDVLSGVVGSLLAQGAAPFDAAQAAAYMVGGAGDTVARERKQALQASDIIEML